MSAVSSDTDSILAGVWLPSGAILQGVHGEISIVGSTQSLLSTVGVYGLEGWILPVEDPDTVGTMNAVWDFFVPKDGTADLLDLDTAVSDSKPFYEPGEISWEFLFDIGRNARRIYHRHKFLSAANGAIMTRQDVETPFLDHYFPGDVQRVSVERPIRVTGPSLVAFAGTSPLGDATSATAAVAAFTEPEWGQIKYIDHVMERAMMAILGLTEAGAESPWEEAADLLREYLDPLVLENNAGALAVNAWNFFGELVFDIIVPGKLPLGMLTGGR